MKTALIHDWLITYRGGEKVLESLIDLYPDADIFTLFHFPGALPEKISSRVKGTSFIQKLPFARKKYRNYLPLMPMAIENFDLSAYDLVISSSHAVAKGVMVHPGSLHISYIHSPMRYIWDRYTDYFGSGSGLKRRLMDLVFSYLRAWDRISASRVDHFIANSSIVSERISKYYGRDATIIHPPVSVDRFTPARKEDKKDYYFILSAFVPYKKVDLAVNAFIKSGRKLIVAGSGPGSKHLRKLIHGRKNISLIEHPDDESVAKLYREARGFIFPGFEDFGITMVEALSSGTPVIAYGAGGALDIVLEGRNGILFPQQSMNSLNRAVAESENTAWDPAAVSATAEKFSREHFLQRIKEFINEKI